LVSKLNSFWKHIGQRKATTTILNVVAMGEYYFSKTNQHVFNESLYVLKGMDYVVQQVLVRIVVEGKKDCSFCIHFSFAFSRKAYDEIRMNVIFVCFPKKT